MLPQKPPSHIQRRKTWQLRNGRAVRELDWRAFGFGIIELRDKPTGRLQSFQFFLRGYRTKHIVRRPTALERGFVLGQKLERSLYQFELPCRLHPGRSRAMV